MPGRYQSYSEYKNSGVEWLGDIPAHWGIKKLKFLANIQPSNVDKKTKEGELPVALCNYTDVYYNDTVDASMNFMKASATEEQIIKFTLRAGDTIITKDSEDPNDIAIPTFVPNDIDGVICGYHLSMIRPYDIGYGAYIKRVFESGYVRAYFATRANGLTRYGLGAYALENVLYPKPSEKEANGIANFLDHETAKIDTLIEKQQQLIRLLKEKRQAVISHAVTKGLNTQASMKDSGVDWLGEVPEHWEVTRLGWITTEINDINHEMPVAVDNGVPFLSAKDLLDDGTLNFTYNIKKISEKDFLRLSEKICPQRDDIIYSRIGAKLGKARLVENNLKFQVSYSCCVIRVKKNRANPLFMSLLLDTDLVLTEAKGRTVGIGVPDLGLNEIARFTIPLPPIEEQCEIESYLLEQTQKYTRLLDTCLEGVKLLQERRTALISAAVTGKIDVRNWQAPEQTQTKEEKAA